MQHFQQRQCLRLRSSHGKYLYANKDGKSVSGRSRHDTLKNVWTVERFNFGEEGSGAVQFFRLRSVYGRYLGASRPYSHGTPSCEAIQTATEVFADDILWICGNMGYGTVFLRLFSGVNQVLRGRRNRVTIDAQLITVNRRGITPEASWEVEIVPLALSLPRAPAAPRRSLTPQTRMIRYIVGNDDGEPANRIWSILEVHDRSLEALRQKFAELFPARALIICFRAGDHGELMPLLVNLPAGKWPMELVLVPSDSQVAPSLRYPAVSMESSAV